MRILSAALPIGCASLALGQSAVSGTWSGVKPASNSGPVRWKIQLVQIDRQDRPISNLFLLIGRRKVRLAYQMVDRFGVLGRGDFEPHSIPKSALTACFGWYAGAGDIFYVVQAKHHFKVYHRDIGEGLDSAPKDVLIATL